MSYAGSGPVEVRVRQIEDGAENGYEQASTQETGRPYERLDPCGKCRSSNVVRRDTL
jgi:hypothetical protein